MTNEEKRIFLIGMIDRDFSTLEEQDKAERVVNELIKAETDALDELKLLYH